MPVIYMTGNDSPTVHKAALESDVGLSREAYLGEIADHAARTSSRPTPT